MAHLCPRGIAGVIALALNAMRGNARRFFTICRRRPFQDGRSGHVEAWRVTALWILSTAVQNSTLVERLLDTTVHCLLVPEYCGIWVCSRHLHAPRALLEVMVGGQPLTIDGKTFFVQLTPVRLLADPEKFARLHCELFGDEHALPASSRFTGRRRLDLWATVYLGGRRAGLTINA